MKKLFKTLKNTAKTMAKNISYKLNAFAIKLQLMKSNSALVLANQRGENYVDSGVKILIAVVLGALLLSGLYALFNDTIMPTITERIKAMFDYKG